MIAGIDEAPALPGTSVGIELSRLRGPPKLLPSSQRYSLASASERVTITVGGLPLLHWKSQRLVEIMDARGGVRQVNKINHLSKSGTVKTFRIALVFSFFGVPPRILCKIASNAGPLTLQERTSVHFDTTTGDIDVVLDHERHAGQGPRFVTLRANSINATGLGKGAIAVNRNKGVEGGLRIGLFGAPPRPAYSRQPSLDAPSAPVQQPIAPSSPARA